MKQGWESKTLGEVCVVERGSSPRPIKDYLTESDDGVNWVKIGDTKNVEKYIYTTKQKITTEGAKKSRFVDVDDFILTNSMSYGKSYIMKTQGYIHDGWFVLRLPNKINPEFFWYLLASPFTLEQFESLAAGAIVKNISGDLVKKTILPIPPLTEQKRIVAILDECFDAIGKAKANVERNLNNAKELFQSELYQIFTKKGNGWEEKKLGEVCNLIGGGTPSKKVDKYYSGDILWATVRDMHNDILEDTDHKITLEGLKNSSSNLIFKGNVVIATRVGLGKICILKNDTAINQDLKGIVPKDKIKLDKKFLFWWFKSISELIVEAGTGATVQGVKLPFIQSLKFHLPKLEEQNRVVSQLNELKTLLCQLETNYKKELDSLEELKKSILQKAFNGELTSAEEVAT